MRHSVTTQSHPDSLPQDQHIRIAELTILLPADLFLTELVAGAFTCPQITFSA
jgi:hypothetical protein